MRQHHQIAFDQPCFEPEETVTQAWEGRMGRCSVRITLNIGLE